MTARYRHILDPHAARGVGGRVARAEQWVVRAPPCVLADGRERVHLVVGGE
jgi:hypothetical protein